LQENINSFSGIELVERAQRFFPDKMGANFIGYLNEVNKEMLAREKYAGYRRGDIAGITGLENQYEKELRGIPGVQYQLRDVKQRIVGSYKEGELDSVAVAGKSLELYLDADLQKLTEEMMANKLGSAIAIEPSTGGILAFASGPTYDPTLLSGNDRSENFKELLNRATKPMFNRAIMARYMPGSTFKPITALVALDEGVISRRFGLGCGGGYYQCGRRIGCTHSGGGHASNLANAIANSCNSYFCHVFMLSIDAPANKNTRVGLARWGKYMSDFGLGHPIGIDIPSERGGNIPTVKYFDRMYNGNWNSCNMSIIGMGQGEVLLTPLQMANAMCIIANRGSYHIPHFVKSIGGDSTHEKLALFLKKNVVAKIADSNFEAVIAGMQDVVDRGTAKVARVPGIAVCGKTGTVENHTRINGKKIKLKNHSMFVAFAPRDKPRIAIAVCVENAGYGSQWAAPIASLMIEKYLTDTISPRRRGLFNKMKNGKVIPSIVYIIDSLEKKEAREKWRAELRRRDSIRILERRKDSIQKARSSSTKNLETRYNYWYKLFMIDPKNRRFEYS
jgi:penicillin-binding protein 2